VKNRERGSIQVAALALGAVLAFVVVGFVCKYCRDVRLYQKGLRLVLPAQPLKKYGLAKRVFPKTPAFDISGSLKNRPVVYKEFPSYPLWAEKGGVSGRVRLIFRVSSSGEVYPNIWVDQTTGHSDFDEAAIRALKHWRFAPAETAAAGHEQADMYSEPTPGQAGIINFHYTLSNKTIQL